MNFECQYQKNGVDVCCKVITVYKIYSGSKKITISGNNNERIDNWSVNYFEISNHYLGAFPRNLHKTFPSLKKLHIIGCGLMKISKEDLAGFRSLEVLVLDDNKLTTLPDNLFEGLKNLRWIYFEGNQIERIGLGILTPIRDSLELADFTRNTNIDEYFDKYENGKSLDKLLDVMRRLS